MQAPSTYNMAARNRPRGTFVKDDLTDAHEERNMWSQIVTDIKRLKITHTRAADVAKLQVEMEAKMGNCKLHSGRPSVFLIKTSSVSNSLSYQTHVIPPVSSVDWFARSSTAAVLLIAHA